jgi:hypothetical protein
MSAAEGKLNIARRLNGVSLAVYAWLNLAPDRSPKPNLGRFSP